MVGHGRCPWKPPTCEGKTFSSPGDARRNRKHPPRAWGRRQHDALGSVTEIARYELARLIREEVKATSCDEDSVKRIRSLASSLSAIANPAKELEWRRKLDKATAEIDELKNELAQQAAEYELKLSEASRRIAELEGGSAKAGMSQETLDRVEEQIRMM